MLMMFYVLFLLIIQIYLLYIDELHGGGRGYTNHPPVLQVLAPLVPIHVYANDAL